MSEEIPTLVATKSDADIASEIRVEVNEALDRVLVILNRAASHKLRVGFQLGVDTFGRSHIQMLEIVKVL